MKDTAKAALSRHGEKQKTIDDIPVEEGGIKVIPASYEDINLIHITPEGKIKLTEAGADFFGSKDSGAHYENVVGKITDIIRTRESFYAMLKDVSTGTVRLEERSNIGFNLPGVNWLHELGPLKKPDSTGHGLIVNLLQNYTFKPEADGLPCVASMMANYIKSVADSVELLREHASDNGNALLHITHAPNIDFFAPLILGYLKVDEKNKIATVDMDKYPGDIQMGQMWKGNVYNLTSSNPTLEVSLNDKHHIGVKVSDLRKYENQAAKYSLL